MDMITVVSRLAALETAAAAKGFVRPELSLTIESSGKFRVFIWAVGVDPEEPKFYKHKGFTGDTPAAALDLAAAWVDAQPDPETRDLQTFQRMLADTIDFGNDKNIDTAPLVVVSQTIASNLLANHAAV